MLETCEDFNDTLAKVMEQGESRESADLSDLSQGTLLALITRSEAAYLLKVQDPKKSLGHVVRLDASRPGLATGYRGLRRISPIEVGEQMRHGDSRTSPIVSIRILKGFFI